MQFKKSFLDVSQYLEKNSSGTITVTFTTNAGATETLAEYPVSPKNSLLIYCNTDPGESILSAANIFEAAHHDLT